MSTYETTKRNRERARAQAQIPDLTKLPDNALLTDRQVSMHSGFSEYTFRFWRTKGRGPKITYLENRPRYRVSDYKSWLSTADCSEMEVA